MEKLQQSKIKKIVFVDENNEIIEIKPKDFTTNHYSSGSRIKKKLFKNWIIIILLKIEYDKYKFWNFTCFMYNKLFYMFFNIYEYTKK